MRPETTMRAVGSGLANLGWDGIKDLRFIGGFHSKGRPPGETKYLFPCVSPVSKVSKIPPGQRTTNFSTWDPSGNAKCSQLEF